MTNFDKSDFVEDALALLRESSVPEGPSDQLLSLTTERIRSITAQDTESLPISRRSMMFRVTWFGSATAACASILAVAVWIGRIDSSVSIAFADVQQQAQKFRSVQYTEMGVVFDADGNPQNPRPPKVDGAGKAGKSKRIPSERHYVMGRDLERVESLDSDGQITSVLITDFNSQKSLQLQVKDKKATVTDLSQKTLSFAGGQTVTFSKIEPASTLLYQELSEIPASATTTLPARKIGDKQAVGFVWERKDERNSGNGIFVETRKRIYWVDPATKLLVRMDCWLTSTDPKMKKRIEWTKSDFLFDAELDQSLFSTEPPEGYAVETGGFILVPTEGADGKEGPFTLQIK